MNEKKRLFFLLGLLLVGLALGGFAYRLFSDDASPGLTAPLTDSSEETPELHPAVSFALEDAAGNALEFSDLLGQKPVVLNFWASTCPPCRSEMPEFFQSYETYGEEISFVMLNVGDAMQGETREKAEAYLAEHDYTFPVYYDVDYSGIQAYGISAFPTTVFIDANGNIVTGVMGMIDGKALTAGLSLIAPELIPRGEWQPISPPST